MGSAVYCTCPAPCARHDQGSARIIGGGQDGQELREVPVDWDAGGGFRALLDEATDAQLVAFADMVRDAIQHRVTHLQRHERDVQARVLFEVAIKRFGHTLRW